MTKSEKKALKEFRDSKSMELFDKPEDLLELDERLKLERYIYDLGHPEWRPVVVNGKPTRYNVSNTGLVLNTESGKLMTINHNEFGYQRTKISVDGKLYTLKIHRLVATAFIPNPENKSEVNHINPNKDLNWVGNLEWSTSKENKQHAILHGLYDNASFLKQGSERPNSVYSDSIVHSVCKMLESGKQPKEISAVLHVPVNLPNSIKYGGKWKYISSQYKIPRPNGIPGYDPSKRSTGVRLSENRVHRICELIDSGASTNDIAAKIGFSRNSIANIKNGKTWTSTSKTYNFRKACQSPPIALNERESSTTIEH